MSKLLLFPLSQPSRAVAWFLEKNNISIPTEIVDITKGEHLTPEFTAKNPFQAVPLLQLEDGTFLSESCAILNYLATVHKVGAEYPLDDPKQIARIQEAQFRHDSLARLVTLKLVRPAFARLYNPELTLDAVKAGIEKNGADLVWALELIDAVLAKSTFVAGPTFTVVDYLIVCELNQLPFVEAAAPVSMHVATYPNIVRYLQEAKAIAGHDKHVAGIAAVGAKLSA